jgi:hypothetical protein
VLARALISRASALYIIVKHAVAASAAYPQVRLIRISHASTIIEVGVARAFFAGIVTPMVLALGALIIDIQVMVAVAAEPYTILVRRGVTSGVLFGHVDDRKRNRLHDEERK